MRQRLSLAGALLGDPGALVLNEPANGLAPQGIRWLRDFLRARAAEGRTVLISSHVLAEVAQTVDEVVVISRGRRVAQGGIDELTRDAAASIRVRTPDPERLREALAANQIVAVLDSPDWLAVSGASLEAVGETIAEHGIVVYELFRHRETLEERSSSSPERRRPLGDPPDSLGAAEAADHAHGLVSGWRRRGACRTHHHAHAGARDGAQRRG